MKRKRFLLKLLAGAGSAAGLSSLVAWHRGSDKEPLSGGDCSPTARETRGPFVTRQPGGVVRENIIGDRIGIPLRIELTILNRSNGCRPLPDAEVDIWHCDGDGKYSEYGGVRMQREDLTSEHFLRGRQRSNAEGSVSFHSIFPGHYPGRSPHIHVEIRDDKERSLLVTQIAFPSQPCEVVYATQHYGSSKYTPNEADGVFRNSLNNNLADSVIGDVERGFILTKEIVV